ncbi:protein ALP1-like [Senna tora]|uniref:Protein ALP1-like n=1 Tax=Senna tora TaxID=362788 RepID=A0A834SHQ2_9FABA|nr:protein ALP1-like [Senna tora]
MMNGFEYDYDKLGEIFNNSTASGKLSQASTQEPPTSDQERLLEDDFLSKGVHVDSQFIDVKCENSNLIGDKRKQTFGSSWERHGMDLRLSWFAKLEVSLKKLTEVMDIRKKVTIAKMERYKKQANETTLSTYSIDACMELLDSMEDVSNVGKLSDGKDVTVDEGVAMFLIIIGQNLRHRIIAERFQHSVYTVSKWFRRVLRGNFIGALDDTHVSAWAPATKKTAFCGRKTVIPQNVMAACDFDKIFNFLYLGWESIASDSLVFLDALKATNNFPHPQRDQFQLVDSDYPNMSRMQNRRERIFEEFSREDMIIQEEHGLEQNKDSMMQYK